MNIKFLIKTEWNEITSKYFFHHIGKLSEEYKKKHKLTFDYYVR